MDDTTGNKFSFAGFVDYHACYHAVDTVWLVAGLLIFFGTFLSVIPQILSIVKNRTNYGLDTFTVLTTHINQYFMVINYLGLHAADFIGLLQISWKITVPRMVTFLNVFILWFAYFSVPLSSMIFSDFAMRSKLSPHIQMKRWRISYILTSVFMAFHVLMTLGSYLIGIGYGFFSTMAARIGQIYGVASSVIVLAQYIPQIITTIRLKDNGSLSLLMLAIQAPGGTINSLFMWIGQGEDWSTWVPFFIGAMQQFILLGICIFFKIKKRKYMRFDQDQSTSTTGPSALLLNKEIDQYT